MSIIYGAYWTLEDKRFFLDCHFSAELLSKKFSQGIVTYFSQLKSIFSSFYLKIWWLIVTVISSSRTGGESNENVKDPSEFSTITVAGPRSSAAIFWTGVSITSNSFSSIIFSSSVVVFGGKTIFFRRYSDCFKCSSEEVMWIMQGAQGLNKVLGK